MAQSTHPGGSADKMGLIYESLWGIRCMADVLEGEASSICVEKLGEDGAEFCLQKGNKKEHWQTKRQVTGQQVWTLQLMLSEGILAYFFSKFRNGDTCVFASISDAPELRELIENAKATVASGGGIEQFKEHMLSEKRGKFFSKLHKAIESGSEEETLNFLCSITLHGGREITLEKEFRYRLGVMFEGPWEITRAAFRDLYISSVHETLTASDIERQLQDYDIKRRHHGIPDSRDRIQGITDTYLAGQRAKLISGKLIERSVAKEIVTKIQSSNSSLSIFITSAAGGGKSACLFQIVSELQEMGLPILAFRLDRIEPVSTPILLGEKLGLGESPAMVLSHSYSDRSVVLVIDQLDCVSSTSGRHTDFFDTVAALYAEVIGLRSSRNIHLVLACRKFDFDHDHRFKQLASEDQSPIELSEFTSQEVTEILRKEGGDFSILSSKQQEMLRLPQNLSLYVDAGLARNGSQFSSSKDLCDAYWNKKIKAVSVQRPEFEQYWPLAIQCLVGIMSEKQELSVPGSSMAEYPLEFLERMVSEGVLTWDRKRYGFAHETFFDYCFARTLPNGGRDFVSFLESDDQHLFRRAQLRQVMAFLRDDDFEGYLATTRSLICSDQIRPHLKLLAVDLLAVIPQPNDAEFELLIPSIESELTSRRNGNMIPILLIDRIYHRLCSLIRRWQWHQEHQAAKTRLASRIWDRFFTSYTLFVVANRMGFIERWLYSGESRLEDTMAYYFRWQTYQNSEQVAELLEPFAGRDDWHQRLRHIMEGVNIDKSRRFFDLFLRFLENGNLDDAKDRLASNGTFWSMIYGFGKKRPAWCAELAARWVDRQIVIATSGENMAQGPRSVLGDPFGSDEILESSRGDPKAFLEHVLPSIIRAAKVFSYNNGDEDFSRDRLWPTRFFGSHLDMSEALLRGCETAFELLGKASPDSLRLFVDQLRIVKLNTANHLLMSAYLSSPTTFADESLDLLADEPKRLLCGYSGSPYWHSRLVIEKCSSHCSTETFQKIETALLRFVSPHEKTNEGFRRRGVAAYNLSSALAKDRLSEKAITQIGIWNEKFHSPYGPPTHDRAFTVVSPIKEESAEHMTDEQWLGAIKKYNTEERRHDFAHPEKGGALELARMLQRFTQEEPERFARLALILPENSHPYYISHILRGLKDARSPSQSKLSVIRLVFETDHDDCLCAALSLVGSITDVELPDDVIQFIRRTAEHSDPEKELWKEEMPYYGGDILSHGINTVRGHVAEAVRDLIWTDERYVGIFSKTIEKLVADPSLAVRACAVSTLHAVALHNFPLALEWSSTLFEADDRLLSTDYVGKFISAGLRGHLRDFSPVIRRMLKSSDEKVRKEGGLLACLARLYHVEAQVLARIALKGDYFCRLGACEVAQKNLLVVECREWCEKTLIRLFNDQNKEVRQKAAGCFWHLWKSPDTSLAEFDHLIRCFLKSRAFVDEPTYLLYAFEETRNQVPEVILDVCEVFIARCGEEARDTRTSLAGDERTVGKLVFTAYAQLESPEQRKRALDVIDRMSLEGLDSAEIQLAEFER